jgi:hypothetical protein
MHPSRVVDLYVFVSEWNNNFGIRDVGKQLKASNTTWTYHALCFVPSILSTTNLEDVPHHNPNAGAISGTFFYHAHP